MPSLSSLSIAARAAAHVPPRALLHHLRRRLRARLVPLRAHAFVATLEREAAALPSAAATVSEPARAAAAIVATFFAAKHAKNVPQCFDGTFTFLNRTHEFGSAEAIDWRVDMDGGRYQLWRANLAFMGYLATAADHDPERGLALAATLTASFRGASRFRRRADFTDLWNSYPVAQRILALSTLLIRAPRELAGTADWRAVDAFLRFNVAYLLRNLETELGFNHLERNLSALALYALAAGETPLRVRRALHAHFDHVVGETIGDDGVQRERSAMYQALTIQSLRVLRELEIWSAEQTALLGRRLAAAEVALAALTLGDDRPTLMNDSWFDETPPTFDVLGDHAAPGFTVLPDAGYVRLAMGDGAAIFDAGAIGPDANPGHGHPDFLSVELSIGRERLIVDPGTSGYSADAARARDRSWDQHNGPAIADGAPVEFTGSFKVGRRVAATLDLAEDRGGVQRAAGSLAFDGVRVSRDVTLDAGSLTLTDRWEMGAGERLSRFLVPTGWALVTEGTGVTLIKGDRRVRLSVEDATLSVGESRWSCRYNLSEPAHEIVVRPAKDRAITTLRWD